MALEPDRLQKQISFIHEIDKLKSIYRQTYLMSGERHENSGEHSWQVALMVNVLAEYADTPIDANRVTLMMLLHDIVEIDAGDVFAYDTVGMAAKFGQEQLAANRIFGLLPEDQRSEFQSLWEEFEACETSDAKFAGVIDRLMPEMHNAFSPSSAWKDHGVTIDRVIERNLHIRDFCPKLWEFTETFIRDAYNGNNEFTQSRQT